MRFLHALTIASALAAFAAACSSTAPTPTPVPTPTAATSPVPSEYKALYSALESRLGAFSRELKTTGDSRRHDAVVAAELLTANGNRGEALLAPATFPATQLYLDRLQGIGIKGVSIQVSYPLLTPGFPRGPEYLAFFRRVAQEVRGRGLKLLIETGPVFPDPEFSNVRADFSSLTPERYFAERQAEAQRIAQELRPDYLSIGDEPGTEEMLTGLTFTLDQYLAYVRNTLKAIDRSGGAKVGAGTGTWEDPRYVERFARETTLDFIDIHIYPMGDSARDYLKRAVDWAALARANGKRALIGETWLYKASTQEVRQGLAYADIFGRDPFSFWEPLDSAFIETMIDLANRRQVDYVSLYWSEYFFAYADYQTTPKDISRVALYRLVNQQAFRNVQADRLSGTGQRLKELLAR